MATSNKSKKILEKARKIAAKTKKKKVSKVDVKKKTTSYPEGQNAPQSKKYTQESDKTLSAKSTGWRWTKEGAKKLGKNVESKPTTSDIEKYRNETFKLKGKPNKSGPKGVGDGSHRYLYVERRADKADITRKNKLEDGGEMMAKGGEVKKGDVVKIQGKDFKVVNKFDSMGTKKYFLVPTDDTKDKYGFLNAMTLTEKELASNTQMAKGGETYRKNELTNIRIVRDDDEKENSYYYNIRTHKRVDDSRIPKNSFVQEYDKKRDGKIDNDEMAKGGKTKKFLTYHEVYDENTGKTLNIQAYSFDEAEEIASTIEYDNFKDGEDIEYGEMARGGKIPSDEVAYFKNYVKDYYGEGGIFSEFFPPVGVSSKEVNLAVNQYIDYCKTKDDQWGGGDTFDREIVRDIMLYNRGTKKGLEYQRAIKEIFGKDKKEYGGILQPMTGGVNADPRFDIYNTTMFAEKGAELANGGKIYDSEDFEDWIYENHSTFDIDNEEFQMFIDEHYQNMLPHAKNFKNLKEWLDGQYSKGGLLSMSESSLSKMLKKLDKYDEIVVGEDEGYGWNWQDYGNMKRSGFKNHLKNKKAALISAIEYIQNKKPKQFLTLEEINGKRISSWKCDVLNIDIGGGPVVWESSKYPYTIYAEPGFEDDKSLHFQVEYDETLNIEGDITGIVFKSSNSAASYDLKTYLSEVKKVIDIIESAKSRKLTPQDFKVSTFIGAKYIKSKGGGVDYEEGGTVKPRVVPIYIYELTYSKHGKKGTFVSKVEAKSEDDAINKWVDQTNRSEGVYTIIDVVKSSRNRMEDGGQMAKGGYVRAYYNDTISGGDNQYQVNLMFFKNKDDDDYFDEEFITTSSPEEAEALAEKINKYGYSSFLPKGKYSWENDYAKGGSTHEQGYDDREDESLAMRHGKIASKDFVGSHARREHSRRDDARFEERHKKAYGGTTDSSIELLD